MADVIRRLRSIDPGIVPPLWGPTVPRRMPGEKVHRWPGPLRDEIGRIWAEAENVLVVRLAAVAPEALRADPEYDVPMIHQAPWCYLLFAAQSKILAVAGDGRLDSARQRDLEAAWDLLFSRDGRQGEVESSR